VNLSPKGYDSLAIIDKRTLAWADLGGSSVETQAHVRENGRITLMFCAFEGAANILRLHGRGEAVAFDHPRFAELMALFPGVKRARAVVLVHLERIADSCGWGVPFFAFQGERDQLRRWVDSRPADEWAARRFEANARSIDGLPGLTPFEGYVLDRTSRAAIAPARASSLGQSAAWWLNQAIWRLA
jgi:hypothetical protein